MEEDYSLNSPHSGAYGTSVRPAVRQGQAPGPRAACGDLGRRPTLPNPHGAFSPRKGGFAHPFHPHSQGRRSPLPLHPPGSLSVWDQRGDFPSLDTPRQRPLAVCPCTLSGVCDGELGICFVSAFGPNQTITNPLTCTSGTCRRGGSLQLGNQVVNECTSNAPYYPIINLMCRRYFHSLHLLGRLV